MTRPALNIGAARSKPIHSRSQRRYSAPVRANDEAPCPGRRAERGAENQSQVGRVYLPGSQRRCAGNRVHSNQRLCTTHMAAGTAGRRIDKAEPYFVIETNAPPATPARTQSWHKSDTPHKQLTLERPAAPCGENINASQTHRVTYSCVHPSRRIACMVAATARTLTHPLLSLLTTSASRPNGPPCCRNRPHSHNAHSRPAR